MTETGKPKRGASGGMQGGPRRGRSPITGPALPTPEAAQTKEEKSPRVRRAHAVQSSDKPKYTSKHEPYPPRRRPKLKKSPRARRAQPPLSKDKPAFNRPEYCPRKLSHAGGQTKEKKSPRARRAQNVSQRISLFNSS